MKKELYAEILHKINNPLQILMIKAEGDERAKDAVRRINDYLKELKKEIDDE